MKAFALALKVALFSSVLVAANSQAQMEAKQLLQLSLEQLLDIEIISVSKDREKLSDSAAAVFVITEEDIHRSAANSVADLLRMVPGVQVAQINANAYAISIRGFNSSFSNKLLVMIDGRTMYTPDFSGVYWEMLDMPLDTIERIEVVRGPGGALWGANAVNGIINIITKTAQATQGNLLAAGGGDKEKGFVDLRHGGKLGNSTYYRISARAAQRDDFPPQDSVWVPIKDHWRTHQLSLRLDGHNDTDGSYTLQTGLTDIRIGEDQWDYWAAHVDEQNYHMLGKWTQQTATGAEWSLQTYYDYKKRLDESLIGLEAKMLDIEFQHQFTRDEHTVLWGIGYRRQDMDTFFTALAEFIPPRRQENQYSLFIQDSIDFDTVRLTLGSKFERHYATGWEIQPSARLNWTLADNNRLWASISRAVRTPSRFESDSYTERDAYPEELLLYVPYDYRVVRNGAQNIQAETVIAYEIGHRYHRGKNLSFDTTAFFNHYDHLIALREQLLLDENTGYTHLFQFQNGMKGDAYGLEIAANWLINPTWRISAAYSWLKLAIEPDSGVETFYDESIETRAPRHQLSLRSNLRLTQNIELDAWLRFVDELPEPNIADEEVYLADRYTTLDLRVAWHPTKQLELALVGRNLINDDRIEFAGEPMTLYFRNRLERSIYAQIKWYF